MNYVIFGRLLRSIIALDDVTNDKKLSFLNPRRVSTIFLGSDIVSFLIQASGSGLAGSNDDSTTRIGLNILLAGMALNLASFTLFISLVVYFDRATCQPYELARMHRRFEPVIHALYISWIFIMVLLRARFTDQIRSIFRIIEFATGWDGPVNTNERFFYIFDASMMYPRKFRNSKFQGPRNSNLHVFFPSQIRSSK